MKSSRLVLASNVDVRVLLAFLIPAALSAALLPGSFGAFQKGAVSQPTLTDSQIWTEYGLRESEAAVFENGPAKFTLTAYRLQDSTGAMAAFEWQRPQKSTASNAAVYAAETPDSLMVVRGNYLLNFTGFKPAAADLQALYDGIVNVEGAPFPTLPGHMPSQGAPNSERYILGPASLQKFNPAIPPSVAAFHLGAEAQLAVFHNPKGDINLTIFEYPTPQIAQKQIVVFQNLPGAVAKRTGTLVAVTVAPPDPDQAERLLSQVQYHGDVTFQEHIATRKDNIGNLVVNAFVLVGILLIICVVGGLAVGALRMSRWRGKGNPDGDTVISLHLE